MNSTATTLLFIAMGVAMVCLFFLFMWMFGYS